MYLHNTDTLQKKQNIINFIKNNDIHLYNFFINEINDELNFYKYYLNIKIDNNLLNYIKKYVLIRQYLYLKYNIHDKTQINNLCLIIKMCLHNTTTLKDFMDNYGFIIENNKIINITNTNYIESFNLTLDKLNTINEYYLIEHPINNINLIGGDDTPTETEPPLNKDDIKSDIKNKSNYIKVIPPDNKIVDDINKSNILSNTDLSNINTLGKSIDEQFDINSLYNLNQIKNSNINNLVDIYFLYNDLQLFKQSNTLIQQYKIISLYQKIITLKEKLNNKFNNLNPIQLNNLVSIFEAYEYCICYLEQFANNKKIDTNMNEEKNALYQFNLDYSGTSLIYADITNCEKPSIYTSTFNLIDEKIPVLPDDFKKIWPLRNINPSLFDNIFKVEPVEIDKIGCGLTQELFKKIVDLYCQSTIDDVFFGKNNKDSKKGEESKESKEDKESEVAKDGKESEKDKDSEVAKEDKVIKDDDGVDEDSKESDVIKTGNNDISNNEYIEIIKSDEKYKEITDKSKRKEYIVTILLKYFLTLISYSIDNHIYIANKKDYPVIGDLLKPIENIIFTRLNLNTGYKIKINLCQYNSIRNHFPFNDEHGKTHYIDEYFDIKDIYTKYLDKYRLITGGDDEEKQYYDKSLYNQQLITDDYIDFIINGYGIKLNNNKLEVNNPNFLIYLYSITEDVLNGINPYAFIHYLPQLTTIKAYFNGEITFIQQQEVINEYNKLIGIFINGTEFIHDKKIELINEDDIFYYLKYDDKTKSFISTFNNDFYEYNKIIYKSHINNSVTEEEKKINIEEYTNYISDKKINNECARSDKDTIQINIKCLKKQLNIEQPYYKYYINIINYFNNINTDKSYTDNYEIVDILKDKDKNNKPLKDKDNKQIEHKISCTQLFKVITWFHKINNNFKIYYYQYIYLFSIVLDKYYEPLKYKLLSNIDIPSLFKKTILPLLTQVINIYYKNQDTNLIDILSEEEPNRPKEFDFYTYNIYYILYFINNFFRIYQIDIKNELDKYNSNTDLQLLFREIPYDSIKKIVNNPEQEITVSERIPYILYDLQFYISYIYLTEILNTITPKITSDTINYEGNNIIIKKYEHTIDKSYKYISLSNKHNIKKYDFFILENETGEKNSIIHINNLNNMLEYYVIMLQYVFEILKKDIFKLIYKSNNKFINEYIEHIFFENILDKGRYYRIYHHLNLLIQSDEVRKYVTTDNKQKLLPILNKIISTNEEIAQLNPSVKKLFELTKKLQKTIEGSYLYVTGGIEYINNIIHTLSINNKLNYYKNNYLQITNDFTPYIYGNEFTSYFDCIIFILLNNSFITKYINSYQWIIDINNNKNKLSYNNSIFYDLVIFYSKCQFYNKITTIEKIYNKYLDNNKDDKNCYINSNESLFDKYYNKFDNIYELFKLLIDIMYSETLNNIFIRQMYYIYINDSIGNEIVINNLAHLNYYNIPSNNELLIFCIPHELIITPFINIHIPKSIQLDSLYKIKYCVVYNIHTDNTIKSNGYYSIYIFNNITNTIFYYNNTKPIEQITIPNVDIGIDYSLPICGKHAEMIIYEKVK